MSNASSRCTGWQRRSPRGTLCVSRTVTERGHERFHIGLPGKSGIGGGIVTVSPGKGGLGTFAPPLDSAGNSVKGQFVAKFLSQRLGMGLFVSRPES
jgi:glutaminase